MKKPACKDCLHYYQHYGINDRKIYRLNCGHCAISKTKTKRPDATICDQFIPGTPDESAFVTKEFFKQGAIGIYDAIGAFASNRGNFHRLQRLIDTQSYLN